MHIHILGICGTFMGSLAQLAKSLGYRVTGSDMNVYPPMSTQLEAAGIELIEGFDVAQLALKPDLIVVGNVISRGNPVMEEVLNSGLPYISGPQWLYEHVLKDKWVLAVAGTHGKTTTTSMLTWILEYAEMEPGYLIGGVPGNFSSSARLGKSDFFVIEADEYDTSFFDKRSKFVHYHPRTVVLNNLEFDHADIFQDLAAIQRQFHHLLRVLPSQALVLFPTGNDALDEVEKMGCWSERQSMGDREECDWRYVVHDASGQHFDIYFEGALVATIKWNLSGLHNVQNALSAVAAARHVGVVPELACEALMQFKGVKRRMELLADIAGVKVFDDFAHHPTAIRSTLEGYRAKVGEDKVLAIIEPRSNTMKQGVYRDELAACSKNADSVLWYEPKNLSWSLGDAVGDANSEVFTDTQLIIDRACELAEEGTHIVIMSNGGFEGLQKRLLDQLRVSLSVEGVK